MHVCRLFFACSILNDGPTNWRSSWHKEAMIKTPPNHVIFFSHSSLRIIKGSVWVWLQSCMQPWFEHSWAFQKKTLRYSPVKRLNNLNILAPWDFLEIAYVRSEDKLAIGLVTTPFRCATVGAVIISLPAFMCHIAGFGRRGTLKIHDAYTFQSPFRVKQLAPWHECVAYQLDKTGTFSAFIRPHAHLMHFCCHAGQRRMDASCHLSPSGPFFRSEINAKNSRRKAKVIGREDTSVCRLSFVCGLNVYSWHCMARRFNKRCYTFLVKKSF